MSRQRRTFTAKFKSDLVIELLKGEKDLNTLATENNIQPNLLRNWKKEFLDNASVVFDDKREDNLKEKLLWSSIFVTPLANKTQRLCTCFLPLLMGASDAPETDHAELLTSKGVLYPL